MPDAAEVFYEYGAHRRTMEEICGRQVRLQRTLTPSSRTAISHRRLQQVTNSRHVVADLREDVVVPVRRLASLRLYIPTVLDRSCAGAMDCVVEHPTDDWST